MYPFLCTFAVATHTGGVDRNLELFVDDLDELVVATHTGGVDRNIAVLSPALFAVLSPPTRVAWIETPKAIRVVQEVSCRHPHGWRG